MHILTGIVMGMAVFLMLSGLHLHITGSLDTQCLLAFLAISYAVTAFVGSLK